MREIKFRAWNKRQKALTPDHALFHFGEGENYIAFDFFNGNFDTLIWDFDDCEIMQFTGLKDKNGVDIYEGDILSFKWLYQDDSIYIENKLIYGQVQFVSGKFIVRYYGSAFDVSDINQATFERFWRETYNAAETDYFKMIGFEVVGNTHENPELLEENNV